MLFGILFSIIFLTSYFLIGQRYALSDVERMFKIARIEHKSIPGQDQRVKREFFLTILCWPYYWFVNRSLLGLLPQIEAQPLRQKARLMITEEREDTERKKELEAAQEAEREIEQKLSKEAARKALELRNRDQENLNLWKQALAQQVRTEWHAKPFFVIDAANQDAKGGSIPKNYACDEYQLYMAWVIASLIENDVTHVVEMGYYGVVRVHTLTEEGYHLPLPMLTDLGYPNANTLEWGKKK